MILCWSLSPGSMAITTQPGRPLPVLQVTPCEHYCWQTSPGVVSPGPPPARRAPARCLPLSPAKTMRSYRDTRKRRDLSGARWLCNHLSHLSSLVVILFCYNEPPWYHLTQHLPRIASKIGTCACCFQTLQLCTRVTGLTSTPWLVQAGLNTPDAETGCWLDQP